MKKLIMVIIFFGILSNLIISDEKKANNPEKTIKDGIIAFREEISSDDEKTRLKAFDAAMPTKDDLKALFGNDVDLIWTRLKGGLDFMRKNTVKFKKEMTRTGKVKEIKLINVRETDPSGRYTELKKTIPEAIPLYRAVITYEKSSGGSSTYVIINEKFKFIRGLEGMHKMIQKLKAVKTK